MKEIFKIPEKDYCDACHKFSLVKMTGKEATYACGTTIRLETEFDDIMDLLTISDFCRKAVMNNIEEEGYIVELHKQKLGGI